MSDLNRMEATLQAVGYTAQVHSAANQRQSYLNVNYGADDLGRDRILNVSLLLSTENAAVTQFAKFSIALPFSIPSEKMADMARAVVIINEELAIGNFGISVDGTLYYQYILAMEQNAPISDEMLVELVNLIEFQQEHFGDYFEGIFDGEISVSVLDKVIKETSP